jgi:hypothetical protein
MEGVLKSEAPYLLCCPFSFFALPSGRLSYSELRRQWRRRKGKHRTTLKPPPSHAGSDHREPSSPRFEPRPLSFWPGIETRHTNRSQKAGNVTRFWLGRSVARCLLGSRSHRKSRGVQFAPEQLHSLAWKERPSSKTDKFYPNSERRDAPLLDETGGAKLSLSTSGH